MPASNFKDISGQKFGRLTAIECVGKNKYNYAVWRCRCECGNETNVPGNSLRSGNTKSCGCLNMENSTNRIVSLNTTHGKTHTRLFRVWSSMRNRCDNPNATNYSDYGARGIRVCDEWESNFEAFFEWAVSQGYDPTAKRGKYTVDRINNDLGYSPENCRLATSKQQANNRRSTHFVTYNGVTKSATEWARYYGKGRSRFSSMSDEQIVQIIDAYEAYKREHGVDKLPRRVNFEFKNTPSGNSRSW